MRKLISKKSHNSLARLKFRRSFGGFTIIEVMIVLAIAGLILAIVFIAVPQLQRNTRDNQRQNLAARLKSELESYAGNNQGKYPFNPVSPGFSACTGTAPNTCGDWLSRYITGSNPPVNIIDPSKGTNITINIGTNQVDASTWTASTAWISVGNRCDGELTQAGAGGGSNARSYALVIALERDKTFYCVDNG